jgi:hypothetical protein
MNGEQYKLDKPARFYSRGRVHVTQDGRPFYVFDKPEGFYFTLPAGTYNVNGGELVGKMPPRKGHRPSKGLRFPLPKKIELVFAPNPHRAIISLRDGVIVADTALKTLPFPSLVFVLFHEIGHYFYEDEAECDRFAAEEMHRRGFTPSQINLATHQTLNDPHRRRCNYTTAQQLNKR